MSSATPTCPVPTGDPARFVPPSVRVDVLEDASQAITYVGGEIDLASCGQLRDAIESHLGPRQRIVLDLSGVTFMDSSSLTVLEHARTQLSADGGSLILRNPSRAALRVLTASHLAPLFTTELA